MTMTILSEPWPHIPCPDTIGRSPIVAGVKIQGRDGNHDTRHFGHESARLLVVAPRRWPGSPLRISPAGGLVSVMDDHDVYRSRDAQLGVWRGDGGRIRF